MSVTNEGETGTLVPESGSLGGLVGSGMSLISSAYKKSAHFACDGRMKRATT